MLARWVGYTPADLTGFSDIRGEVLDGRYRVREKIGSGGFGAVYAAEHVITGRMFAIKVLVPALDRQPREAERLMREAQTTARVDHENIVDIVDVGRTAAGALYFSMELLKGDTLEALLAREGRLPWPRVRAMLRQICAALRAAHGQGVVHRDLKPANIFLVTRMGNPDVVKILDFGIAKLLRPDDGGAGAATSRHEIVGTPLYMAPEQAAGDRIDARTDVYAVGVILYEMLAGRRPFYGASPVALLANILRGEPPLIADVAPEAGVPDAVDAFVATALAREPGQRFVDMDAMIAAIPGDGEVSGSRPSMSAPRAPVGAGVVEPLAETQVARAATVKASTVRVPTGMTTRSGSSRGRGGTRGVAVALVVGGLAVAAAIAYLLTRPPGEPALAADTVVYHACKIRITGDTPGIAGQKITEAWIELESGETHTLKAVGGRELVFTCLEKLSHGTLVVRFENRVGYRFPNIILYPETAVTKLPMSAGQRELPSTVAPRPTVTTDAGCAELSDEACQARCEQGKQAASCYDMGIRMQRGVRLVTGEANEFHEKACELGHGRACAVLGANLDKGIGVRARDPGEALASFVRACKLRDSWGCFNAAWSDLLSREHARVVAGWKRLDEACNLGNARACNAIGVAYRRGEFGQRVDRELARGQFARACELKDPLGSFKGCGNLAELLVAEQGDAVRVRELAEQTCNASSANECRDLLFGHAYTQRCERVTSQACLLFAHMLETGSGGPADPARARQIVVGPKTGVAYSGEAAY